MNATTGKETDYIREITMRILHKYVPIKQVRAQLAKWLEWPVEDLELLMCFQSSKEPTYMSQNDCDKERWHDTYALLDHYYLNDYRITRSTYIEIARRRHNPLVEDQMFVCKFPIDAPPYKNIYKVPDPWYPCQWRYQFRSVSDSITFYMFPPGYKPTEEVPTYRTISPLEPVTRPRWGWNPEP